MSAEKAVVYEKVDAPPEPLPGGEPVGALPGEGAPAVGSLRAQVQAGRARAQQAHTMDIEIPGYAGTLWGTFRAIDDFKERARVEQRWQRVRSVSQRALDVAAELLRVACLDCFVPTDKFVPGEEHPGDRFSLEMTLGVKLADWLGVLPPNAAGIVNDHEAMFPMGEDPDGQSYGIFPSTLALTTTAGQLHTFSAGVGEEVDEEAEGNS
jgi:hypothetical protein